MTFCIKTICEQIPNFHSSMSTVNFLNIRTPKTFVVITLKFELCGSTIEPYHRVQTMQTECQTV